MKNLRITFLQDMRKAALILLLTPFLITQAVAQGTMLQAGPDGFNVVLCQGDQIVSAVLTSTGTDDPAPTSLHEDALAPCGWASLVGAAVLVGGDVVFDPVIAPLAFAWDTPQVGSLQTSSDEQARAPPSDV